MSEKESGDYLRQSNKNKKKSLYYKMIFSILRTFIIILIFMEAASIWTIMAEKKRTEDTYIAALELHTSYWNTKFESITGAMATLLNSKDTNYYTTLCKPVKDLDFYVAKKKMVDSMSSLIQANGQEFVVFLFIPSTETFITTSTHLSDYREQVEITDQIKQLCRKAEFVTGKHWKLIPSANRTWMGKTLTDGSGYMGVLLDIKNLTVGPEEFLKDFSTLTIMDHEGTDLLTGTVVGNPESTYLFAKTPLGNADCYLATENIDHNVHSRMFGLIVIILLMTVIGIYSVYRTIRYQMFTFFRPLVRLKMVMEEFGNGNLKARINTTCDTEEMDAVYHAFNEMAAQVETLKLDIYEKQMENQEIQFNYLRLQVKPHFYTNVLSLIHGLAETRDYEGIQRLSKSVATYFRYLMNNSVKFLPLKRELECIDNFIDIQKIRYPGHIQYVLENHTDPMETIEILPMMLLTFVENSIKHNITFVETIEIHLLLETRERHLRVTIRDNGLGFDADILERLKNDEDISDNGEHIGLVNLKKRMSQVYGSNFVLELSNETVGTRAFMEVPMEGT